MGMVFGKISVETPSYEVAAKLDGGAEVREYNPCIVAEVTYDPASMKRGRDGGFMILADYIGALGKANNRRPDAEQQEAEKIAMTAPVITKQAASADEDNGEKIAMTAPVITQQQQQHNKNVTMQFVLPSKFTSVEAVPRPNDSRVSIKAVEKKKYGVITFSGVADDRLVSEKLESLRSSLQKAGYKITGDFMLARYNPPWTLSFLRTNEVMLPVE